MDEPIQPTSDDSQNGYLLPRQQEASITPPEADPNRNAAVDLIRQKVANIYEDEPNAKEELAENSGSGPFRSKHQAYMHELSTSGKSLVDIQIEWHNYYQSLTEAEKHQVWQEFYENSQNSPFFVKSGQQAGPNPAPQPQPQPQPEPQVAAPVQAEAVNPSQAVVADHTPKEPPRPQQGDQRSTAAIKSQLLNRISAGGQLKAKHHLQSLAFGLGFGGLVLVILLFSFFNEVIIAPFIQPNSHASATPVIIDPNSVAVSSTPEVIIPKINVEIPVDYSQTTTDESQIENALNSGVVHYPTTVLPGQQGNAAFFGHSSNNIFNPGKYKFAFVLLHELVPGDTFYLTRDSKAYVYKVISKTIVDPSDVSVLNNVPGQTATATLITCDPPGTSLRRLVVVGQQISPDPSTDTAGNNTSGGISNNTSPILPGNGPTLLSRLWHDIF